MVLTLLCTVVRLALKFKRTTLYLASSAKYQHKLENFIPQMQHKLQIAKFFFGSTYGLLYFAHLIR